MTADLSADAYAVLGTGYDAWCHSVTEDIDFYVRLAIECGGPVLEIGVGSGRIAVPTALAGIAVVGVDRSSADARPGAGEGARPGRVARAGPRRHAGAARAGHASRS